MVYHPEDTTTSPEEDTEYADIYIPVPYDPEIPGVRCVDAEEVENENETNLPGQNTKAENIELETFGSNDSDSGPQTELDFEMRDIDTEITTRL